MPTAYTIPVDLETPQRAAIDGARAALECRTKEREADSSFKLAISLVAELVREVRGRVAVVAYDIDSLLRQANGLPRDAVDTRNLLIRQALDKASELLSDTVCPATDAAAEVAEKTWLATIADTHKLRVSLLVQGFTSPAKSLGGSFEALRSFKKIKDKLDTITKLQTTLRCILEVAKLLSDLFSLVRDVQRLWEDVQRLADQIEGAPSDLQLDRFAQVPKGLLADVPGFSLGLSVAPGSSSGSDGNGNGNGNGVGAGGDGDPDDDG